MKKKIALLSLIIAMSTTTSFSQSLANTTWTGYTPSSGFWAYLHFSTDTMFQSGNNITYTPTATYTVNGNNFTIVDISTTACSTPGTYTFTIQNDSLDFTLINDQCGIRASVLANFYFVALTTGIEVINPTTDINIFPNPITNGIVNLNIGESFGARDLLVSIFSYNGTKLFEKKTTIHSTYEINLKDVSSGIYLMKIFDGEKSRCKKLTVVRN